MSASEHWKCFWLHAEILHLLKIAVLWSENGCFNLSNCRMNLKNKSDFCIVPIRPTQCSHFIYGKYISFHLTFFLACIRFNKLKETKHKQRTGQFRRLDIQKQRLVQVCVGISRYLVQGCFICICWCLGPLKKCMWLLLYRIYLVSTVCAALCDRL